MKYLSLFSGIGGFELGIDKAYENLQNIFQSEELEFKTKDSAKLGQRGLDAKPAKRLGNPICVGYSEIDKYAIQVYEKHFKHRNYGDITKINARDLPEFDLLVGGFPCQAFSIAGKRRGFNDTRGTLFFDIARILEEKKPRNFILENVKGLLSHDGGRTFKTIITTLTELGYCVEWQVLNAKNFGVPQNRERVFIIGHFGAIPRRKIFPIQEGYKQNINQLNNPRHSNDRICGKDGISPTLNTMGGGNRQPFIACDLTRRERLGYRLRKVQRAGTLDSNYYKGLANQERPGVTDGIRVRRLTPLECERLMGFDDGWTLGLSDTQRYKTLGNGVVSNVVAEIVKSLINTK